MEHPAEQFEKEQLQKHRGVISDIFWTAQSANGWNVWIGQGDCKLLVKLLLSLDSRKLADILSA